MLSVWRPLTRKPAPARLQSPPFFLQKTRAFNLLSGMSERFDFNHVNPKTSGQKLDDLLHFRHKRENVYVRPDGYVRVYDALKYMQWFNVNVHELQMFLDHTNPGRFEFILQPDAHAALDPKNHYLWWIRKKGFNLKRNKDCAVSRCIDPRSLRHAIYKAPADEWDDLKTNGIVPTIRKGKGLIVLSPRDDVEEHTDPVNKSFIYISLDIRKALGAGVDFYYSRRLNILSPGDRSGVIKPELFKSVTEVDITKNVLEDVLK